MLTSQDQKNKQRTNMVYRLFATDLDGTLLNREKVLPDHLSEMLDDLIESGIHVVLATGRMTESVFRLIESMEFRPIIISFQGAHISFPDGNEVRNFLSTEKIRDIGAFCKKYNLHMHTYGDGKIYSVDVNELLYRDPDTKFSTIEVIEDFTVFDKEPTGKIFCVRKTEDIDELTKLLAEEFPDLYVVKSSKDLIEITELKANKSNALDTVVKRLNISPCEVVAIGDGLNDLPMIEWAGLGLAVGNAHPVLKSRSNAVMDGEYSEGVAEAIRKYLL